MTKQNSDYWHWHYNSYPTNKGIHFSFTTINFALRFMRKFKTMPVKRTIKYFYDKDYAVAGHGRSWYTVKILNQDKPTDKQYTWLKRCKPDKKEKPITFEEFKQGYKVWEGEKDEKGRTVWYVSGKDYKDGKGYYASALDENTVIWTLQQAFISLRDRGDL